MKKVFLIIFFIFSVFFLVFFGLQRNQAFAQICQSPAVCTTGVSQCPNGGTQQGTCTQPTAKTSIPGICCIANNSNSGGGSKDPYQWGSWGQPPPGTSLGDLSNFFGSGAPAHTSKFVWQVYISRGIQLLLIIVVVLSLAFLILGGFGWMSSGGDKQKLAQARERVAAAIIGLVIAFLSFLIIQTIGTFFGINFLNLP